MSTVAKDLTEDILNEIIAGANTSLEQLLALALRAERRDRNRFYERLPGKRPDRSDEDGCDIDYMEPSEIHQLGKDDGWNAYHDAVMKLDEKVKPLSRPVDHGFRDNCECSSCQTTARICSELTDKSSLIYEVNVGGNTWVECTRAAYVRAKDKGELTRVVTNHPNNELKDHQIRELVNELRDIAVTYHGTQQLREKIARAVNNSLKGGESQPKRIRITHIGENGVEIHQFSVGDIFDVHGEEFGEPHITMLTG
ncbi:hypothetical protein RCN60_11200 [Escherichia marmotae]|nr:hypothetical protein [Escherichia marmotae]